jgi:hypothetical protein
MPDRWVVEETENVDLHDERLNERIREILGRLGERPTASIPEACGGYAEMAAAYRFFDNERVGFDDVLGPHREATRRRIAAQPVALLPQDTTELDLTRPHRQIADAGPLDEGGRRGALLHLMHAFTPDGTPLGTLRAVAWTRDDEAETNATRSRAQRAATPIEEKESARWPEAMRQAREEARLCPGTRLVCIADSEGDIYEMLSEGMAQPRDVDWIVRACQDRALTDDPAEAEAEAEAEANHIREAILATPALMTQTIHVRGREPKDGRETRRRRQPRRSRTALVEIRAGRVTLRPPWRADRRLPRLTINVVMVREIDPPADDVAVEWILLTSLGIETLEDIITIIQYYGVRWMIEIFFRVLKSGCRVEERRFERMDRLARCLAVYLIVAWRTLYVCRLGRSLPEISCEAVFEPAEWKAVCQVTRRGPPPKAPPPLREMVRMVAQLGGYVNRKQGAEPGPQTVWLGLQRMYDMAQCWLSFGPGSGFV